MARNADVLTFDPKVTQDDDSMWAELELYDRLVSLAADGSSVEPELATAWKAADDGLSVTFTLRQGVKFSDGTPLSADDVAFSLGRAIDQTGPWGFLFSAVTSVNKVDDQTVRLSLSQPFAPLMLALSTFAGSIYSKANFEKLGEQKAGQQPLGTGPFKLDSWTKGSQVVLVKNTYYWQAGNPHLDKVIFNAVTDDNARVLQLQAGAADIIDYPPPNQIDQIRSSGMKIVSVPGTAIGKIAFNNITPPLDNTDARCAISWALDRQSIADKIYGGQATPAKSIFPPSTAFYDGNASPMGYDLTKAKELLATSSVPNGFTVEVQVPNGNQPMLDLVQIWTADLAKIGVTLKLKELDQTTLAQLRIEEKYSIMIGQWSNDTPDPDEIAGVLLDPANQHANHTNYNNPAVLTLVGAGRAEQDPVKRAKIYSDIQRFYNTDCPGTYSVALDRTFATTVNVQGFQPNTQGKYGFMNVWKP